MMQVCFLDHYLYDIVFNLQPARLIKYHCEYKGLDSRKHAKLVFEDTLKQTVSVTVVTFLI